MASPVQTAQAAITARLEQSADRHVAELVEWLRIPSVSSDSRHNDDMTNGAEWIASKLRRAGLAVEIIATEGHAMVYAQTPPVAGAPVALVYGHYDVQPPEPLDQWTSPPFEPTVRRGNLYARGATDDKGQVLTHVQSVCEWLETGHPMPIQVKFLIEGEEEVGSENLDRMLPELAEKLACDCVVISDSSQYADGQPAITYGLRGIAAFELRVDGPAQDLHSGSFGGAITNPAVALARMLASIIDADGRILIPGFYDDVEDLDQAERTAWATLPTTEREFAESVGTDVSFGETGYSADERRWARPSFDINGLTSGHQGEGGKTIVPATATAKFSFRLVPDQNPASLQQALHDHLQQVALPGVRWRLDGDHHAAAMRADPNSRFAQAATAAIRDAFGAEPVLIREGGSIPIVGQFQTILKCDCLLMGWGLSDDNMHSPNEKFRLADYHRGILASAKLWGEMGKIN